MKKRKWWLIIFLIFLVIAFVVAFAYIYLHQVTHVTGVEQEIKDFFPNVNFDQVKDIWNNITKSIQGMVNNL